MAQIQVDRRFGAHRPRGGAGARLLKLRSGTAQCDAVQACAVRLTQTRGAHRPAPDEWATGEQWATVGGAGGCKIATVVRDRAGGPRLRGCAQSEMPLPGHRQGPEGPLETLGWVEGGRQHVMDMRASSGTWLWQAPVDKMVLPAPVDYVYPKGQG